MSAVRLPVKAAVIAVAVLGLAALWAPSASATGVRDVVFVGNNWDGTADVIEPRRNFNRIARLNIIPDIDERMLEIDANPVRLGVLPRRSASSSARATTSSSTTCSLDQRRPAADRLAAEPRRRGRRSTWHRRRSSGASWSTASAPTTWRSRPTASTSRSPPRPGNVVHILDTATGEEVGQFESGDSPHENNYSADGERIYHASIGLVYTPGRPAGGRLDQGRSLLPDRRREHQRDPRADRHGPEARGGRLSRA